MGAGECGAGVALLDQSNVLDRSLPKRVYPARLMKMQTIIGSIMDF